MKSEGVLKAMTMVIFDDVSNTTGEMVVIPVVKMNIGAEYAGSEIDINLAPELNV